MQAQKSTLSNGLEVVYLQLPSSLNFRLFLDVPVGAVHDPIGKEGLSHVLEHTVLCGTDSTLEKDYKSKIIAVGGEDRAATGADQTTYSFSASAQDPENFSVIADILRQVITEPSFISERVNIEKKVIVNEWAEKQDSFFDSPLFNLQKAMHNASQRSADVIGTKETINSVESEDLQKFIKDNYDAGQMTLYAAGPLPFDDAIDVLEQTLSAIPNLGKDKMIGYDISCSETDIRNVREELNQNQATFMFVSPHAKNLREYLINYEAGFYLSQHIQSHLRENYGCVYSIDFGIYDNNQSTDINYLSAKTMPEDKDMVCQGLVDFKQNLDTLMEADTIRTSLNNRIYYYSNPDQIGTDILETAQNYYGDYNFLFDPEEIIGVLESITPDDVRARAKEVLGSLTGMYVQGPEPDALPSLELLREQLGSDVEEPELLSAFKPAERHY